MARHRNPWTKADQQRANRAGWGVFNFDFSGGRIIPLVKPEIQRLDETPRFASDVAAVAHVKEQAKRSLTARRALKVCGVAA